MGLGSILGGIAGAINPLVAGGTALLGGAGEMVGQAQANKANVGMMREQQRFEERMSSTAYQRATADMRAAGINPMLAIQQGGASTPSTGMASQSNIVPTGLGQRLSATALDTMRLRNETGIADKQMEMIGNSAREKDAEARIAQALARVVEEDPRLYAAGKYGGWLGQMTNSVVLPFKTMSEEAGKMGSKFMDYMRPKASTAKDVIGQQLREKSRQSGSYRKEKGEQYKRYLQVPESQRSKWWDQ